MERPKLERSALSVSASSVGEEGVRSKAIMRGVRESAVGSDGCVASRISPSAWRPSSWMVRRLRRRAAEPSIRSMSSERAPILILADDAIGAALLGALVETLGYSVQFGRGFESANDAMRRTRPSVCLLDANDRAAACDEALGHAAM